MAVALTASRPTAHGGRHVGLVVGYRGTAYAGFQVQPGRDTVQGRLEAALADLVGAPVAVRGAGRTDAGVHAAGQVADARLPPDFRLPAIRLPFALQRRLPADIRVACAWPAAPGFHPRFHAQSKRYRYLVWRAPVASPFWAPYAWHFHGRLDVPAMAAGAAALAGRHDLRAFAGAGRPVADATRTILECLVWERGPWLAVEVEADGFLYRMARCIAGTLWRVGTGALRPSDLAAIADGGRRQDAGPVLPAHGLCLLGVRYPPEAGAPADWPPAPGPEGEPAIRP